MFQHASRRAAKKTQKPTLRTQNGRKEWDWLSISTMALTKQVSLCWGEEPNMSIHLLNNHQY